MNLGILGEHQESQPPDQQGLEARSYFSLDLCSQFKKKKKNAFITEAETVNAGTKFISRDKAQQYVEEHTEETVEMSWQQGGGTHPDRKGVGTPP